MVDNTDAEGRLVLTDGFARAGEEGATHMVDIATLTGACVRALGPSVAGIMGNDRELVQRVIRSGENHGEAFWELPLVEEYRESLKTPYADINNIASGGLAGAITAGLFLREFVPTATAWAHLDIAGPMFKDKEWKYYEAGALGFGVKTLVDLCERFREELTA
jgi:leucyl aminopeptidase